MYYVVCVCDERSTRCAYMLKQLEFPIYASIKNGTTWGPRLQNRRDNRHMFSRFMHFVADNKSNWREWREKWRERLPTHRQTQYRGKATNLICSATNRLSYETYDVRWDKRSKRTLIVTLTPYPTTTSTSTTSPYLLNWYDTLLEYWI